MFYEQIRIKQTNSCKYYKCTTKRPGAKFEYFYTYKKTNKPNQQHYQSLSLTHTCNSPITDNQRKQLLLIICIRYFLQKTGKKNKQTNKRYKQKTSKAIYSNIKPQFFHYTRPKQTNIKLIASSTTFMFSNCSSSTFFIP